MDSKSLELLEFPKVRELLAGHTSFEVSHALAHQIVPLTDAAAIARLLEQSSQARRLLDEDPSFVIGQLSDIRDPVKMAALGKVLDSLILLEVEQMLATMRVLRRALGRHASTFPRLWEIAAAIKEMPEIEKEIARCISLNGDILDSASDELGSIRRRLKKTRESLLSRLDATLKSARGQKIIQDPIITEREGRYVIPIKAEHRKDIRGIVHDVSNTGATLFVEPWAALDLGNEVRQLLSEEKYEIERILRDLSVRIAARAEDITRNVDLTAELDLVMAKARYALRAKAVEPQVVAEATSPSLKLRDARHPLLGDKAVPLTVEIGKDFSILVISGPNMGGKTVALKTIGLLSAMALSGIPISASDQSIVPLFDGIFADIGDEQSIEHTVSTFSWHVSNIVRIIDRSTAKSLVLLDELGAATDPAEGSALARSILLFLLSHRTLAVTTSHYDDLKAFAHTTEGLRNASLDLDPVTGLPAYHLTLGIPGGSNALAVAEHLGLPASIIDAARQMMGEGTRELESLLIDLGKEKAGAARLREELEEQRKSLRKRETELEHRASEVRAEERRLVEKTRDVVVREAADLQRDIRTALAELRKERTRETVENARMALAAVQLRLRSQVWSPPVQERPVEDGKIKPGDVVLLREANLKATVLSISADGSQAEIQAGRATMTIAVSGLEKVTADSATSRPKVVPVTRQLYRSAVSLQLDLRGKRADEVEAALDSYLNTASLSGLGEVRIVHGGATGTVRKIVRDLLSSHPLVKSYRPGDRYEGADGATVVKL
jgi:DNA mismatch repair protein MutS2